MSMTRRILGAAALIGLGILALTGNGCGSGDSEGGGRPAAEPDKTRPATASAQATRPTQAADALEIEDVEESPPVVPNIALQVDFGSALTVQQGTPLIFTVRLANQWASNVMSLNTARAAGDHAGPPEAVPVLKLAPRLPQSVRFQLLAEDSAVGPLDWPLAVVGQQAAESITLDGVTNPQAMWSLSPGSAAKIAPGVYRVVAALEAGEGDTFWAGRVVSAPVTITIKAREAGPAGPLAVESGLASASYWAEVKDWDKSLAAARKVVQDDPGSIDGHTMLGEALAAKNDAEGAMAAYATAIRQKYTGPGGEVPEYLLAQMRRLMLENPPKDLAPDGTNAPPLP